MQWKIVYETPPPTWEGQPGKLWTPVPRDHREVADAIFMILERHNPIKITIKRTDEIPAGATTATTPDRKA